MGSVFLVILNALKNLMVNNLQDQYPGNAISL
jgi:hypothetical protein